MAILEFWNSLKTAWINHGAAICLGVALTFLVLVAFYNKIRGYKGTYSASGQYYVSPSRISQKLKRGSRPRESKGEIECRRVLESLFRARFPSQRPSFLRNPVTGNRFNLELDCYNADLRLAVEYNGVQHYKYTPYFHRNKDQFMTQRYRDDMKRRLCQENGITLIEVPYTIKLKDIKRYIFNECRRAGYQV